MPADRRKNFRVEWGNTAGNITFGDGRRRKCLVSNLSNGGAKISGVKATGLPDEFELTIETEIEQAFKCRVRWRADNELGVRFFDYHAVQTAKEEQDIPGNRTGGQV